MAYIFHFNPDTPMSSTKYDEIMKRLDSAGASAPAGRLYHACYGSADRLRVFDVWDSPASFEQFGGTLLPILQDLGVDPGQPEVVETHNIVVG
ncbi:MAG: hypothetical protein DMF56_01780 [Acidobacteria bacterium]|nr:MAG: hypothetical protein DMF56_01780 [Acidobacteriota bacterium]